MPRQIIAAFVSVLLLAALPAHADNPQQQKMTSCNADAKTKGLTGDARKDFMKTCLSASSTAPAAAGNSQQQKMKTCNADASAKGLKGDERKAFMKSCLSAG